jgi:hypothetical protein
VATPTGSLLTLQRWIHSSVMSGTGTEIVSLPVVELCTIIDRKRAGFTSFTIRAARYPGSTKSVLLGYTRSAAQQIGLALHFTT